MCVGAGAGGTARSLALTHINQNRETIFEALRGLSLAMRSGAFARILELYLKAAGTDMNLRLCGTFNNIGKLIRASRVAARGRGVG